MLTDFKILLLTDLAVNFEQCYYPTTP